MTRKYYDGFLVKSDGVYCGSIKTYFKKEILFSSKEGKRHWSRVENYYEDFHTALNSYLETFTKEDRVTDTKNQGLIFN